VNAPVHAREGLSNTSAEELDFLFGEEGERVVDLHLVRRGGRHGGNGAQELLLLLLNRLRGRGGRDNANCVVVGAGQLLPPTYVVLHVCMIAWCTFRNEEQKELPAVRIELMTL
jgi:hypothetical protein